MTLPTIAIPKHWKLGEGFSSLDYVAAGLAQRRPWHRVPGGWIADEVERKECVILCEFDAHKFNPRRNGYEVWRDVQVKAFCDDCKQWSPRCRSFIHQATHDAVGDDRPRRGRWARRS